MNGERLPTLARRHLELILSGQAGLSPDQLIGEDADLAQLGATFVTLTVQGRLRGCIGTLQAHRSLAADLLNNAMAAALQDSRFPQVTAGELANIAVEVSLLTPPEELHYQEAADLLQRLQPGVHGVILHLQGHRATYLPQVWQQLPEPTQFLTSLCYKAGLAGDCWRRGARVEVYTVEKFHEISG